MPGAPAAAFAYRDSLLESVSGNAANMAEFNARCQETLSALEAELKREDLTDEGRKLVIDGIMGIIEMISKKDSENKEFLSRVLHGTILVSAFALVCLAAALGLRVKTSRDD